MINKNVPEIQEQISACLLACTEECIFLLVIVCFLLWLFACILFGVSELRRVSRAAAEYAVRLSYLLDVLCLNLL